MSAEERGSTSLISAISCCDLRLKFGWVTMRSTDTSGPRSFEFRESWWTWIRPKAPRFQIKTSLWRALLVITPLKKRQFITLHAVGRSNSPLISDHDTSTFEMLPVSNCDHEILLGCCRPAKNSCRGRAPQWTFALREEFFVYALGLVFHFRVARSLHPIDSVASVLFFADQIESTVAWNGTNRTVHFGSRAVDSAILWRREFAAVPRCTDWHNWARIFEILGALEKARSTYYS